MSSDQTNRPTQPHATQAPVRRTPTTATTTAAGPTQAAGPGTRTMTQMITVPGWLPAAVFLAGFILGILGRKARE